MKQPRKKVIIGVARPVEASEKSIFMEGKESSPYFQVSIIFIELSFRLALGRAHTHEPTLSRIRAPVDSETAIVVNGGKAREREVSDAKGNSSTKASVVITRPSCLIDSPSIIQSRKQSQRPLKKDDFYFNLRY